VFPQGEPFGLRGSLQVPLTSSHEPTWWHSSSATHGISSPTHSPASQASPVVHSLPSLQAVPSVPGIWVQPAVGEQASTVQGSPSSQLMAVPPPHTPAWQL
jgi:hypothetical protein